jgi:hypothetical protein
MEMVMTILGKLNEARPDEWDKVQGMCPDEDSTKWQVANEIYKSHTTGEWCEEVDSIFNGRHKPVASDGSSTDYYKLPEGATDIQDLIEHQGMDFAQGNVFKAAWRVGTKEGISDLYDWKKIRWFSDRKIKELEQWEQEECDYVQNKGIY